MPRCGTARLASHTEAATGSQLPRFIKDEFDAFRECGILVHGFLRVRCGGCGYDTLLAFGCERRGFCPSCGARRMSQTAAHRVDHLIPQVPVQQWVLSLPIPLRLMLAARPGPHLYGAEAAFLRTLPGTARELTPGLSEARVRFAARHEYARTVEYVPARRSRLLFLDARRAAAVAPAVAALLREETGMDPRLEDFGRLALQHATLPD